MRQETIIKTYKRFIELSELQQDKVVEKYSDINVDCNHWYEHVYEEYKEKLKRLGFYDINIEFSGFWSQGDGASFTAKHKRGDVTKSGRYSHSYSMNSENDIILLVARRIADRLYKSLNSDYDCLTSRDAIVETIEANEYEFDVDTLELA